MVVPTMTHGGPMVAYVNVWDLECFKFNSFSLIHRLIICLDHLEYELGANLGSALVEVEYTVTWKISHSENFLGIRFRSGKR